MNATPLPASATLRDAMYALSFAQRLPNAELLEEIVGRYPQYADALTDFAIALAMDSLQDESAIEASEASIDVTQVSPAVGRAISRYQNRAHAVDQAAAAAVRVESTNLVGAFGPLSALDRDGFRQFAADIGANTAFAAKVRDRQIDPLTIPEGFRQRVAQSLHAPIELVVAHFAAGNAGSSARQFFKADGKPNLEMKQSFDEAVRNSGLTEEQQRDLLAL